LEPNTCFALKLGSAVPDGLATPVNHEQLQSVAPKSGLLQFVTVVTETPWPLEDWQPKRNVP